MQVYLIDVHKLGKTVFNTPGTKDKGKYTTLKIVLEDPNIEKVFFDVRNDSDALYAHFSVHLSGIQDIQLHQFVTRPRKGRFLSGLGKCIDHDAGLSFTKRVKSADIKEKGKRLFPPELGGPYEVFNVRPMSEDIVRYCAQDVQILPRLWAVYNRRGIGAAMKRKVADAVWERIDVCLEVGYTGKGRDRALGQRIFCMRFDKHAVEDTTDDSEGEAQNDECRNAPESTTLSFRIAYDSPKSGDDDEETIGDWLGQSTKDIQSAHRFGDIHSRAAGMGGVGSTRVWVHSLLCSFR
ncbi:hypothetical protein BDV06DRAFT_218283 [Aspergillus oleicola]